ncbi:hypothetical protein FH972_010525 [Carpinus fangiana]|uniref:Uncharacterized protein n=1 Tax=Carpinus fangiana TaxID=176857 RepID=A0A660KNJ8_9ROSI|nr:hypothetical protein FH972_010525 [Carpinus fangiana]
MKFSGNPNIIHLITALHVVDIHPIGLEHGPANHRLEISVSTWWAREGFKQGRVPSTRFTVTNHNGQVLDMLWQALPEVEGFLITMMLNSQLEYWVFHVFMEG